MNIHKHHSCLYDYINSFQFQKPSWCVILMYECLCNFTFKNTQNHSQYKTRIINEYLKLIC